jgi:CHAD domain-containing protein
MTTEATQALIGHVRKHTNRLLRNADLAMRQGSVDAVHDYRVASRRLREPLTVMQPWVNNSDVRKVLRDLRRVRRICRRVRDLDVLQASLAEGRQATELSADELAHLEGLITGQRLRRMRKAARRIVRMNVRGLGKRIVTLANRFVEHVDTSQACERACGLWLTRALKLRACAPTAGSAQLHRTRLSLKGLRYCTELLDMMGGRDGSPLIAHCTAMQDLLGAWNDDLVAAGYLAGFALADDQLTEHEAWSAGILDYASRRIRLAEAGRSEILAAWPSLASKIEAYGDELCSNRAAGIASPPAARDAD